MLAAVGLECSGKSRNARFGTGAFSIRVVLLEHRFDFLASILGHIDHDQEFAFLQRFLELLEAAILGARK
jgi:hypothetical protein